MDTDRKILIVHDSPAKADQLQKVLQGGSNKEGVAEVHAEMGLEAMLRQQPWDLILYSCESFGAAQTIIYFLRKFCPHTALIAITNSADMDLAVALMKMGVSNCVPWNNISGLNAVIEHEMEILDNSQSTVPEPPQSADDKLSRMREMQFFLCAILDYLPFLVWMKDLNNRYIMVNNTFAQYSGLPGPDRAVGKTDLDIWPLDLATRYRREDRKVLESGQPATYDEEVSAANVRKWVEISRMPVYNDGGQLIGTAGFARDISLRKEYEDALEYHSTLLNATLDTLPDGILLIDLDGHIVYANKACHELWGISEAENAELEDQQVLALAASMLKQPEQFMAMVMNSNEEPTRESADLLEFKDGRVIRRTAKPIRQGGQVFGRVMCFRLVGDGE